MKRLLLILFTIFLISSPVQGEFFKDIIVTSSTGIWTDSRAYTTLNAAVTAIGASEQDLYIAKKEVVTTLVIPANIRLHFVKDGSIANSNTLTINTKNIHADHQIFTGAGAVNFASNTEVHSRWFVDFETAITQTSNDTVVLIIDTVDTLLNSATVGNNVLLKWDGPNLITIVAGQTLSNIGDISAPNIRLFVISGAITFNASSPLKKIDANWFGTSLASLSLADNAATIAKKQLIFSGIWVIDADLTLSSDLKILPDTDLQIATTKTLTINGTLEAGLYKIFSCAGTGKVVLAAGSNQTIVPQWWGASPSATATVNSAAIQASFVALANNTSWTLPPGIYTCDASLVIGSYSSDLWGLDVNFKGQLLFDTCSGLDIRRIRYSTFKGINVKRTALDWDANHFGVKFGDCRRNNIDLQSLENFTYGFYLDGNAVQNLYNTFHLGCIKDNQYGQYVDSSSGGVNNENSYYGGQFIQSTELTYPYTAVNITANTITVANTFVTGDKIYFRTNPLTNFVLPAPLIIGNTYNAIYVDATTIKIAASYADAIAGTAIDLTTQGAGTHYVGRGYVWGVYFAGGASNRYDNHRWYGPAFENLQGGMYLSGYANANQMFLSHPRFEGVANWIEVAPRNLTWIQGASFIASSDMPIFLPRLNDGSGNSIVTILGSGYAGIDAYKAYATPKENGLSWYNFNDLSQKTDLVNTVPDYFAIRHDEWITSAIGTIRTTSSYLNKHFQAASVPVSPLNPMTYAKNAVVWNTNVASGQPMGWVCSKSGSVFGVGTVGSPPSGVGTVDAGTPTTLTMTTAGNSYCYFPGAFITIAGVQHQIKTIVSYDAGTTLAVFTLYDAPIPGTGLAIVGDHPTWVIMANYL